MSSVILAHHSAALALAPEGAVKHERRKFSAEFKRHAVSLCADRSLSDVAAELGIAGSMLSRWRAALNNRNYRERLGPDRRNKEGASELQLLHAVIAKLPASEASRYSVARELRSRFRVRELCHVLGVSRSGFYAWLTRQQSTAAH